ncbi:MAG: DUF3592 domain-containing protein [Ferruginibacter sp.]|nr:DUF3592 domain-containing protein [Ferruginibacter sp.]
MKINKYKLYLVLMLILLGATYGKQIWYALTFIKTTGIIREYESQLNYGGRRTTISYFPLVDFNLGEATYSFYGSSNLHETYVEGSKVPVIYNPKNPSKAYVYTFLGYWGNSFLIVFPIFVVLSMFLLSVGVLPKILVINRNSIINRFR